MRPDARLDSFEVVPARLEPFATADVEQQGA